MPKLNKFCADLCDGEQKSVKSYNPATMAYIGCLMDEPTHEVLNECNQKGISGAKEAFNKGVQKVKKVGQRVKTTVTGWGR